MTNKKLRETLMLIAQGAGMPLTKDDDYFDPQDECLTNLGLFIAAVQREFNLPSKSRLTSPHNLYKFDNIDTVVELVSEAIELDR